MTRYYVTVTEAELEVVRLALGRMLEPRKVPERNAAKAPNVYSHGKPPKLTDKQRLDVTRRWADAVANPNRWHDDLQFSAGKGTNRYGDSVTKAWGLS